MDTQITARSGYLRWGGLISSLRAFLLSTQFPPPPCFKGREANEGRLNFAQKMNEGGKARSQQLPLRDSITWEMLRYSGELSEQSIHIWVGLLVSDNGRTSGRSTSAWEGQRRSRSFEGGYALSVRGRGKKEKGKKKHKNTPELQPMLLKAPLNLIKQAKG